MSDTVNDMIDREIHAKLQELYELTKKNAERLEQESKDLFAVLCDLDEKLKRTEAQLKLWKGTGL